MRHTRRRRRQSARRFRKQPRNAARVEADVLSRRPAERRIRKRLDKGGLMKSGTLRSRMTTCVFSTTLVVLLFSFVLSAQGRCGRILGSVKDPTGAVQPGATVNIKEKFMSTESNLRMHLSRALVWVFFGLALLATATVAVAGPCAGPGAPLCRRPALGLCNGHRIGLMLRMLVSLEPPRHFCFVLVDSLRRHLLSR